MEVPMPAPIPTQDYVHGSQALALLIRLVDVDDLWTREAQRPAESRNVDELERLIDEILRLWRELQLMFPRLGAAFTRSETDLRTMYDDLVEGRVEVTRRDGRREPAFPEDLRSRIREEVDGRAGGDITVLVREVVDTADELIDRECGLVKAESARIASGGRSDGDMSAEASGLVHGLAIAVAAETGPIGGVVVEVVAALLDWLFG